MKPIRAWQGVRMRRLMIGADPDAPPRPLTLPASWDDAAGAALAALAPGSAAASLAVVADAWIRPLTDRARRRNLAPLGDALHALLRWRQGAPSQDIWSGTPAAQPGFVLNLAAFFDAAAGFDVPGFEAAIDVAVTALTLAAPGEPRIGVGFADLAGLLACLGVPYDSSSARDLTACLAALLRARADAASARLAGLFGTAEADDTAPPDPPTTCVLPGLAEAAERAWATRPRGGLRHQATTAIVAPGPVDALLGVETGGIAPAFSPLASAGGLTRTARAELAARGLSAEMALAELIAGIDHLAPVGGTAAAAMRAAVAAYVHTIPPPIATPIGIGEAPAAPARRALPARSPGYTQRATIAGHTLFLRTGEYADGRLGEICITPQKESPSVRALLECFAQAVSMGLQQGVPLRDYVEAFTLTRFGAAGTVDGDPDVARATSVLDYVFRNLAVHYLGSAAALPQADAPPAAASPTPLLPLDLPQDNRPRPSRARALRVVA